MIAVRYMPAMLMIAVKYVSAINHMITIFTGPSHRACLHREAHVVHCWLLLDGSTCFICSVSYRASVYDYAEICSLLHQSGIIGAKNSWANCNMMEDVMPTMLWPWMLTVRRSILVLGVWGNSVDCECINSFWTLALVVNLGTDIGTVFRLKGFTLYGIFDKP